MFHPHEEEERAADICQADRFDGFDRGDTDMPEPCGEGTYSNDPDDDIEF